MFTASFWKLARDTRLLVGVRTATGILDSGSWLSDCALGWGQCPRGAQVMPLAATGFAVLADAALPVVTADLNRSTIWLLAALPPPPVIDASAERRLVR